MLSLPAKALWFFCFDIVHLRPDDLYLLLDRVLCPDCCAELAHHAAAVFVEVRKRVRAADFCVLWLESLDSKNSVWDRRHYPPSLLGRPSW